MPSTLSITEGQPTSWPKIDPEDEGASIPATASETESELNQYARAAWQRVESWVAFRWGVRSCVFVVEGPGDWIAPLQPFTATTVEIWADNAWSTVALAPNALGGLVLDQVGPYRFTGDLGTANAPPEGVRFAVFRLARFFQGAAASSDEASTMNYRLQLGSDLSVEKQRGANWIARAMQMSGAGDLLRPWRRLGT